MMVCQLHTHDGVTAAGVHCSLRVSESSLIVRACHESSLLSKCHCSGIIVC